jgi:hypothetical protein
VLDGLDTSTPLIQERSEVQQPLFFMLEVTTSHYYGRTRYAIVPTEHTYVHDEGRKRSDKPIIVGVTISDIPDVLTATTQIAVARPLTFPEVHYLYRDIERTLCRPTAASRLAIIIYVSPYDYISGYKKDHKKSGYAIVVMIRMLNTDMTANKKQNDIWKELGIRDTSKIIAVNPYRSLEIADVHKDFKPLPFDSKICSPPAALHIRGIRNLPADEILSHLSADEREVVVDTQVFAQHGTSHDICDAILIKKDKCHDILCTLPGRSTEAMRHPQAAIAIAEGNGLHLIRFTTEDNPFLLPPKKPDSVTALPLNPKRAGNSHTTSQYGPKPRK